MKNSRQLLCVLLSICLLLLALPLSGCGKNASSKGTLTVYNWEDYIDPEVLKDFEEETGIKITYVKFTTNEEMYIKLTSGGSNYDVAFPSDYMIERMRREDQLEKLDHSKLPNLKHISDWLQNPGYDENNQYSIPYFWGTVGILYNKKMVEGGQVTSWASMWDTKYQKNVLMMDSIRDSLGVTLKYLGYSLNTNDKTELEKARDKLIEQRESGVLLALGVDEIKDKMINEEAAMGLVWSGDAVTSMDKNEDLAYCIPEEGSNIWVDGMVIMKNSKHKEEAYAFLDFMSRPENAKRNSDYVGYSTPNKDALTQFDEEMLANPAFNPSEEILSRCEFMHDLKENLDYYNRIWLEATT